MLAGPGCDLSEEPAVGVEPVALDSVVAPVLIVAAAWTGARWGELTGLQRIHTHLDTGADNGAGSGVIVIDPGLGTLHESSRGLALGPPKTVESAGTITLPPFLVELMICKP